MLQFAWGTEILDMGAGVQFSFEKYIDDSGEKEYIFDCIDLNDLKEDAALPQNVRTFWKANLEEPLKIDQKYDYVVCFEVIEHVDKTDELIKNAYNALKSGGMLFLSFPNLSSLYARIELLLGFQPHCLEISNEEGCANLGTGPFGRHNNPNARPIHHIRGITLRAGKELVTHYGFTVDKIYGTIPSSGMMGKILKFRPQWCSCVLLMCRKI